jgi:ribose/xylose/arabinose/galactoside ABC-type transport system permease subunit
MNRNGIQIGSLREHNYRAGFSKLTKEYGIVIAIIAMAIVFSLLSEYFLKVDNLRNILLQSATVSIVAIGQAFVITSGEFDLSVGQNACVTGCLAAYMMKFMGIDPWVSITTTLVLGTLIGLLNGVLVAYAGIPAFIATLGMQNVARGFAKIITNATPIPTLPQEIAFLGRGYVLGIPFAAVLMISLYIIAAFVSRKTRFGRYVYAIGGGAEAAFFSGINIRKHKCITFTLAGFMAALSGIVLISRLNSASITNGNLYEFDAIIACVIGGISLAGGRGRIIQALFGAVFLMLFFNGMTMLNVDPFYQDVLKGIVLVVAIGIDVIRNRRRV